MLREPHETLGLCLLMLAAIGCDRIGEPIVDHQHSPPAGVGPVLCRSPAACSEFSGEHQLNPPAARPAIARDLTACGRFAPQPCVEPNDDDAGMMGGMIGDPGCNMDSDPTTPDALSGSQLNCTDVHIDTSQLSAGSASITDLRLYDVNLNVESTTPIEIDIDEASLQGVSIELSGPVTLRFRHAVLFEDVSVRSRAGKPGAQLAIESTEVLQLLIGDAAQPFEGRVSVTRSRLNETQISCQQLRLESVPFDLGRIHAEVVDAADAFVTTTYLELGDSTFTASHINQSEIASCSALRLIDSHLESTNIAACLPGPLRIYDGDFANGMVDGEVECDRASFSGTYFGKRAPTHLSAFNCGVASSNFCAQAEHTFLALGSRISCSTCDEGPQRFCADATSRREALNFCERLEMLNLCTETFPERERPVVD